MLLSRFMDRAFYNELIHVPLIIQLPGQTQGNRTSDQVSSLDVLPTLLDILDISV